MLVVDARSVVRGKLKAAGTMRLDCWLEGDVTCSRLEIGRDGYILGTVTARELIVEGQIVGNVEASVVHLMEGAFVEGDIRHSVISIHSGATLLGRAVRTRRIRANRARRARGQGRRRPARARGRVPGQCKDRRRRLAALSDPARSRLEAPNSRLARALCVAGEDDLRVAVAPAVDLGKAGWKRDFAP